MSRRHRDHPDKLQIDLSDREAGRARMIAYLDQRISEMQAGRAKIQQFDDADTWFSGTTIGVKRF